MFDEIAVLTAPLQYLIADRGSKAYEQNMGPWSRSRPAVATGLELVEEVEAHQRRWRFTIARATATTSNREVQWILYLSAVCASAGRAGRTVAYGSVRLGARRLKVTYGSSKCGDYILRLRHSLVHY